MVGWLQEGNNFFEMTDFISEGKWIQGVELEFECKGGGQ